MINDKVKKTKDEDNQEKEQDILPFDIHQMKMSDKVTK